MTRGCPLCRIEIEQNDDREYARHRFHMLSYCKEILETIKDEVLQEHLKEYKSFSNELETKRKTFNKRISEFKKELRAEMNIESILDHISDIKRQTKRIFHREIKKRGGIFKTAIEKYNSAYAEDRLLFKERSPWFFNTKNKRDFW
jgi:cysteinyl-tRNA synthetase